MQIDRARSQFIDYLRIERSLSSNTISAYTRDLMRFEEFLNESTLDSVDSKTLLAFEVSLKQAGLTQSSINRVLSTLRGFFKFLQREFDRPDPTVDLIPTKVPRRLPKALSVSEISSIIDATQREFDPSSLRDRSIVELLYGTGARVSEIVGLNVSDINTVDVEGDSVTVIKLRGKGSKERIVPVGDFAKRALDEYMVRLRPSLSEKSKGSQGALFLNQRGARLSRQSAWQIVYDAAKAVGLESRVSPHVFRHSYATHLLDGGADIRVVQELLGHSSVTTTQIYTLITIDKVRESYITAHPRAR